MSSLSKTCSVSGCESKTLTRGLCNKHYLRLWRRRKTDLAPKSNVKKICSVDECGRKHYGRGYCTKHYKRVMARRKPSTVSLRVTKTPEQRFWDKVNRGSLDDCWEWQGSLHKGYGRIQYNGKGIPTHRLAFILTNGELTKGLHVCHKCDNKKCVNPNHLFLGTHEQNMKDMCQKGRQAKGERVNNAKLTEPQAKAILTMKGSKTPLHVAKEFGVDQATIRDIWHRKTWRHIQASSCCVRRSDDGFK
jgi:hypothetical protein